jgi:hypothetical protein
MLRGWPLAVWLAAPALQQHQPTLSLNSLSADPCGNSAFVTACCLLVLSYMQVGAQYVVLPKDLDYQPTSTTQILANIRAPSCCPLRVDFAGGEHMYKACDVDAAASETETGRA